MTYLTFSRCLRDGEQKVIFDVDIFSLLFHARLSKLQVIYLFNFSRTLGKSLHFWKPDQDLRQCPNSGAVDSCSGAVEGIFVDLDPD
jgi:hypothetical protein